MWIFYEYSYHVHSTYSDGNLQLRIIQKPRVRIDEIGISDHYIFKWWTFFSGDMQLVD